MNARIQLKKVSRVCVINFFAPLFFFTLCLSSPFATHAGYLTSGQPDGVMLLSPPPAIDSPEQAADLASARAIFKARTLAEETRATNDATLRIFTFTPAIGSFFQPGKFPKIEMLFERVKTNISLAVDEPKKEWKRLRPYQIDPELTLGRPESNPSYPSGHSTRGTVQALMLAELFPDRLDAILEHGREIGWDRVLIGKHFPTDIYAGRVLGQAIFRELMANAEFQHDLAEAKAELDTALGEEPNRNVLSNDAKTNSAFTGEVAVSSSNKMLKLNGSFSGTNPTVKLPTKEKLKIYLLMGQSNMAGRGVPEDEDKKPHPRVFVFVQSNQWQIAVEPITPGEPKKNPGVGPGLAFAKVMADAQPHLAIGLVPCAVGGTPLRRWVKGGDLYERAVQRARAAAAFGTIAGILWHQGESDSASQTNAETYGERLTKMIGDIRAELNLPNLPFVVGQTGEFNYSRPGNPQPFAQHVNETLGNISKTVPFTACALSKDLTSKADLVHFDAKSQRELGKRYAVEMLKLEKSHKLKRAESERKLLEK